MTLEIIGEMEFFFLLLHLVFLGVGEGVKQ